MHSPSKEEALVDFLKGLRIILSNALAYPMDHPYFIKSVKVFQQKIDGAFSFLKPLKISITQDSLFLDGKYWEKLPLYVELASLFHYRKIKSIEFSPGLSQEELINFLASVSKPVREILRQGGIKSILNKLKGTHITAEELDYSELLNASGEELKDIWVYLFKTAVEDRDIKKINSFASNFKNIIENFRGKDLVDDSDLRQSLYNFLSLLKEAEKEKFISCAKRLLSFALKDNSLRAEATLDQLKSFFSDLDEETSAEIFLDTVCEVENYDSLSLGVFSRLFADNAHRVMAISLAKKIKDSNIINTNPRAIKKIKELFLVPDNPQVLPFYRDALKWLSDINSLNENLIFDRNLLYRNYCFLLLNLLSQENDCAVLNEIADSILKEYNNIIKAGDFEYLGLLNKAIDGKLSACGRSANILSALQEKISLFLENSVFQDEEFNNLDSFIETIKTSSLGIELYIRKIFYEGKINISVLKLMFKLFPLNLAQFYDKLKQRSHDIEFLAKVVNNLGNIDTPLSFEALKNIFYFSNNIIRAEILKSMAKLNNYDEELLFSILKGSGYLLKRQALLILLKRSQSTARPLEILFCIPSYFGRKNGILIEHINIIEDMCLKDAKDYLEKFSKRRFFWNRDLRDKAREVLKKCDDRKN